MSEWQEVECPHCGVWFDIEEPRPFGVVVECMACEEHFPLHPENAVNRQAAAPGAAA